MWPTVEAFFGVAAMFFQSVFDIKVVVGYCQGLWVLKLGLSQLASFLKVKETQMCSPCWVWQLAHDYCVCKDEKLLWAWRKCVWRVLLWNGSENWKKACREIMMLQYLRPLMIPQPMLVHTHFHHPTIFLVDFDVNKRNNFLHIKLFSPFFIWLFSIYLVFFPVRIRVKVGWETWPEFDPEFDQASIFNPNVTIDP